jgi:hypothetical protein
MSELPGRVRRAFRDHGSFERRDDGRFESVTTPFEAVVDADTAGGGEIAFDVTVRVPMLDEVVDGEVAEIVEEGWFETFSLRAVDVSGVTSRERDLSPDVSETSHDGTRVAVVEASFTDIDERRGVDDAGALIDFVEGTYVQGIIPGYDYTDPVAGLIDRARQTAGSDGV